MKKPLTKKQLKALEVLLDYIAEDECEHYFTTSLNPADHIWTSIRALYALVFGNKALKDLEKQHE